MTVRRRVLALFASATLATLAWPGPASGSAALGGYSGYAIAEPIHLEIFDPTIPLPSDPQVDFSVAYTKAATETGPVSRATASYLWPGDVLGDGFGQLAGGDQNYPIQVNSKYPATSAAPAKNKAQVTDGNGMSTASDERATTARATGLGIAGPDTNLTGGIGSGLNQLSGQGNSGGSPNPPDLPVPVSSTLAKVMTLENVKSVSTTTLSSSSFAVSSEAVASDIELLGGMIKIKGLDMTAGTRSNGTKAVNAGHSAITGLEIGGQTFSLDERGVTAPGNATELPALPDSLVKGLAQVGIGIQAAQVSKHVQGAAADYRAQGLVITVETKPLRAALSAPFGLLSQIVSQLPSQLSDQLGPMLNLAPKFVITVGDVRSSASASQGYEGGPLPGGGPVAPGGVTGTGAGAGAPGATGGGGSGLGGGGGLASGGGAIGGAGGATGAGAGAPTLSQPATTPAAFNLPGLGDVPRALILVGLALAGGLGWLLRNFGGLLLGGGRDCRFGLATGVPDLRLKG
jgi:hypothetical protein